MEIFISIFISVFNFVLFYFTFSQYPGYAIKKKNYQKFFDFIQKEGNNKEEENNIIDFCGDCFIKKEKRSKHCDVCKRCIINFDHHCYYIDNCIGKKNLRIFAFFILFLTFSIFLQIILQILILVKSFEYKSKFDILHFFTKNDGFLTSFHYWGIIFYLLISLFFLASSLYFKKNIIKIYFTFCLHWDNYL